MGVPAVVTFSARDAAETERVFGVLAKALGVHRDVPDLGYSLPEGTLMGTVREDESAADLRQRAAEALAEAGLEVDHLFVGVLADWSTSHRPLEGRRP